MSSLLASMIARASRYLPSPMRDLTSCRSCSTASLEKNSTAPRARTSHLSLITSVYDSHARDAAIGISTSATRMPALMTLTSPWEPIVCMLPLGERLLSKQHVHAHRPKAHGSQIHAWLTKPGCRAVRNHGGGVPPGNNTALMTRNPPQRGSAVPRPRAPHSARRQAKPEPNAHPPFLLERFSIISLLHHQCQGCPASGSPTVRMPRMRTFSLPLQPSRATSLDVGQCSGHGGSAMYFFEALCVWGRS